MELFKLEKGNLTPFAKIEEEHLFSGLQNRLLHQPDLNKMKCVLISNASSCIGKETAYIFTKNGYNLILTARADRFPGSSPARTTHRFIC